MAKQTPAHLADQKKQGRTAEDTTATNEMKETRQLLDPIRPGEILYEEFMEPLGITKYRLAKSIHVPATRIGEIIAGKRRITADTDLRLCRYFGLTEGYWQRLQVDYDTRVARRKLQVDLEAIEPLETSDGVLVPADEDDWEPEPTAETRIEPLGQIHPEPPSPETYPLEDMQILASGESGLSVGEPVAQAGATRKVRIELNYKVEIESDVIQSPVGLPPEGPGSALPEGTGNTESIDLMQLLARMKSEEAKS